MAETGTRSAGDCVEAVDSLGYWSKGKIVKWVNEGEMRSHDGDDDDVGPGFEVQFAGWSREWNRVVSPSNIRDVTEIPPVKPSRRDTAKNVAMLKLHKDDVREVLVDGEVKEARVIQIDPIRNNIIVDIAGAKTTVQLQSFASSMPDNGSSSCSTVTPRKAKKQKTESRKQTVKRKQKAENCLRKPPAVPCQRQHNEDVDGGINDDNLPLQLVLGSSFFEVGEICSFLGYLVVIISSIVYCARTKETQVLCNVCTTVGEIVTGVEPQCELKCKANHLQKTNRKASHAMKTRGKTLQMHAVGAVVGTINGGLSYQRLQRQLKLGFLLRESCLELLKSRQLKKTVITLFDALDPHIFSLGTQHKIKYVVEENFDTLDMLMGSMWDVHCVSPPVPGEHFFFIRSVSVDINSVRLVFTLAKGRSIFPFSDNYRELAVQSLRSVVCETPKQDFVQT